MKNTLAVVPVVRKITGELVVKTLANYNIAEIASVKRILVHAVLVMGTIGVTPVTSHAKFQNVRVLLNVPKLKDQNATIALKENGEKDVMQHVRMNAFLVALGHQASASQKTMSVENI